MPDLAAEGDAKTPRQHIGFALDRFFRNRQIEISNEDFCDLQNLLVLIVDFIVDKGFEE
jgi:hypothetical protein